MGAAPSGKRATISGITVDRFEEREILEAGRNIDTLGLLRVSGALPGHPKAA